MGLHIGGLMSAIQGAAATIASLVGQTITALKFTSSQASGSDAFSVTTTGARWHIGAGATDYLYSDGVTIYSGGSFQATTAYASTGFVGPSIILSGLSGSGISITSYTDDSATPGNRTVNKMRGKNAFAIGAAAVTVTNSFVTANSQVICSLEFVDATLTSILTVIPAAGSFTVTADVNATAATKFSWLVIN